MMLSCAMVGHESVTDAAFQLPGVAVELEKGT
jgi:hypothetical protein